MDFCGLQKTTLLDYPGHVAATLFTGGCNFRCPYCHNSELLPAGVPCLYSEDDILTFLTKRKGVLEGICITGGEPALHRNLPDFIRRARSLGYLIKLDTNGSNPAMLETLIGEGLVDYVAMDIKNSPEKYAETAGVPGLSLEPIKKSARLLLNGTLPYEFRTTVTRELHTPRDFQEIAGWLSGSRAYYIQNYRDSEQVLCRDRFHPCSGEQLLEFAEILKTKIPAAAVRGLESV